MNVYLFELKRLFKPFMIWTLCVLAALLFLMEGFFPLLLESKGEIEAVFMNMPAEFIRAFALDPATIFSYDGFYAFTFFYIALMSAILSASFAIRIFAREKISKCMDFIFTKPKGRAGLFAAKYLAGLTALSAGTLAYGAVLAAVFSGGAAQSVDAGRFFMLVLSEFLTKLIFFSSALGWAVFAKRVRSVSGAATAIGFAAFLLSAIAGVLDEDIWMLIAPMKYFDPLYLFTDGAFDPKLAAAGAAVVVACTLAGFLRFCRRDVAVL